MQTLKTKATTVIRSLQYVKPSLHKQQLQKETLNLQKHRQCFS